MPNIINLTWNGAIDNKEISSYELQFKTSDKLAWSKPIIIEHDDNYNDNSVNSGGGSYSFMVTDVYEHKFRLKIKNSEGQVSQYKQITAPVDNSLIFISIQSLVTLQLTCMTYNAVTPIILRDGNSGIVTSINNNITFVKNINNTVFDGKNNNWKIKIKDKNFSCTINNVGLITSHIDCSNLLSASTFTKLSYAYISDSFLSNSVNSLICEGYVEGKVYFTGESIEVSSIIYTDYELTAKFNGNNYYLLSYNNETYIAKISNQGVVETIQEFISVCPAQ